MNRNKKYGLILICVLALSIVIVIAPSYAATSKGIISFTFDDGTLNQYTTIFPLMQEYGVHGTFYIITGNYGSNPAPDGLYQDRADEIPIKGLLEMQSAGNEIGSHTVTHHDLAFLTDSQITWECSQSKTTLQSWGITNVDSFAYPQGISDYAHADTIAKQYYQTTRSFVFPYTPIALPVHSGFQDLMAVSAEYEGAGCSYSYNDQLASNKQYIDYAVKNNAWVILLVHNAAETEEMAEEYGGIYVNDLSDLFQYAKSSGAQVLTVHQALASNVTPTPMPTFSPTPKPTATPTIIPTVTPSPTSTVTPQPTVSPSPTSIPDPLFGLTQAQRADYANWLSNGSALQTYRNIIG
jgi:peptidoglycan/xylan/chitin deacetylase (PgdA/CDA1 family)